MKPIRAMRHPSRGHHVHHRSLLSSRAMALGLCIAAFSIPATGLCASPADPPLFIDAQSAVPPAIAQAFPSPELSKHWVRRHRTVGLNPAALEAMKRARKESKVGITLDLFDSGTRTMELDEPETHRNKTKVWRGRLRGEQDSGVTLAVHGTQMVGTITSGQRLYKIEPAENNRHRLVEIDDDAMPPDHHPRVVPDDGTPAGPPAPDPELQQPDAAAATGAVTTAAAPTNTTVDLLVVYTGAARKKQGGPNAPKLEAQAAMSALIAMGVDLANQAYTNSRIAMQLRLVAVREVAYVETGDMGLDLDRVTSSTDGSMDQVHQWRTQYKADLVAMIVENGGSYCGIAWVMANGPRASFARYAFSVTARECVANNTMTHEIGHNMGDAHDRANAGGTGVYPYSYGYQDPGYFRTIMAYSCSNIRCPRVNYFSNPRVLINGRPAGIDYAVNPTRAADNARSMNEVRNVIAGWSTTLSTAAAPSAGGMKDSRAKSRVESPDDADNDADEDTDDDAEDDAREKPTKDSPGKSRGKSRAPLP